MPKNESQQPTPPVIDPVPPPAAPPAAPTTPEAATDDEVQVRMLVDHPVGDVQVLKCNTVQTLPAAFARALVARGIADDNAEAVKAALSS